MSSGEFPIRTLRPEVLELIHDHLLVESCFSQAKVKVFVAEL